MVGQKHHWRGLQPYRIRKWCKAPIDLMICGDFHRVQTTRCIQEIIDMDMPDVVKAEEEKWRASVQSCAQQQLSPVTGCVAGLKEFFSNCVCLWLGCAHMPGDFRTRRPCWMPCINGLSGH
eukprot:scaffold2705_cov152-Amphora_coffeaeformis.AAC.4